MDWSSVCDLDWNGHALKLAKAAGARVVVVHMAGQNSEEFLKVPMEQAARRAMMLAKEIPRQEGCGLKVSLGGVIEPSEVDRLLRKLGAEAGAAQLRARCYAGAERGKGKIAAQAQEKAHDLAVPTRRMSEGVIAEVDFLRKIAHSIRRKYFVCVATKFTLTNKGQTT